jgi:hypothetical protein
MKVASAVSSLNSHTYALKTLTLFDIFSFHLREGTINVICIYFLKLRDAKKPSHGLHI